MSVFKEMRFRRFWICVAISVLAVLAIAACGAGLIVTGVCPVECARVWICAAWLVGTFLGGRCIAAGEGGALWRCVPLAVTAILLLWLPGLTTTGSASLTDRLLYAGMALAGAVAAAALPRKKRRSRGVKRHDKR